jgi:hypothetical protein
VKHVDRNTPHHPSRPRARAAERRRLLGLALALPSGAAAQNAATSFCKNGALPFAATEANRLAGPALTQALSGKRLVYVRESNKTAGIWFNLGREFRADGSSVHSCQAGRGPSGPWGACRQIGEEKVNVAGPRDVGVWNVKGNSFCVTSASFGERSTGCFALHRQGQALAAKQISGHRSFCVEGAITLQ